MVDLHRDWAEMGTLGSIVQTVSHDMYAQSRTSLWKFAVLKNSPPLFSNPRPPPYQTPSSPSPCLQKAKPI